MSKKNVALVFWIVIIAALIGLVRGNKRLDTAYYPDALYVANVDEKGAYAVSINGNAFILEGSWSLGDVAAVTMYNRHTADKKDDVIVQIRYAGNLGVKEAE